MVELDLREFSLPSMLTDSIAIEDILKYFIEIMVS